MKVRRLFVIGGGAFLVNLLLFAVMERMASRQAVDLKAPSTALSIDFVRLKRDPEPVSVKPREKPPEKKVEQDLMTPPTPVPRPKPLRVQEINMQMPRIDLAMNISGVPFLGKMSNSDFSGLSEAIPLVRTAPLYPPSALSRKIEGRVRVLFTVTENGAVAEPEVIESEPPNVFNAAALRAIRNWKFRKKMVDGVPVAWKSVQTIIFRLER